MLQGRRRHHLLVPSNEIYPAMQTGSLDAAVTSSTSLISFRLEEISKAATSGSDGSFWFMFEPLLMSKSVFDCLTPDQQKAIARSAPSSSPSRWSRPRPTTIALADVLRQGRRQGRRSSPPRRWPSGARSRATAAWKDFAAAAPPAPTC